MRRKSIAQENTQKMAGSFASVPEIVPAHILVPTIIIYILGRFGGLFFFINMTTGLRKTVKY